MRDWGDRHPKLVDRLVAMVRRLEWCGLEDGPTCPVCRALCGLHREGPHYPGCELAALLEEVGRG